MKLILDNTYDKITSPYGRVLVEKLRSYSDVLSITKRRNLYFNLREILFCYIILEGYFGVYRKNDSRLLAIVSYPTILGMKGMLNIKTDIFLKALTPAKVGRLTVDNFHSFIQRENLWEELAKHLVLLSERLYISSEQINAPTATEMVLTQLQELMLEPDIIRNNITAESYIKDKTGLSRSRIMGVLSELKKSGHIDIYKGILLRLSINMESS
ncbi:hypothetical protein GKR53_23315 [Klebsiella sp. HSTU-Sny5]|uniref:helix-turn-helix domain-containing protein n=1 Tax=Klebsiella sp. HSTU-Sny5 TaxID=2663238 RepID=UPI001FB5E4E7|nr:helix-turn-helix domain-containing protein [Klebsiella sp. HSTU-Sny5]MCJ1876950.1 hypothetical protein [Klebsiella sp. HSTU-Sny5]